MSALKSQGNVTAPKDAEVGSRRSNRASLELDRISKSYGPTVALRDFSFSFYSGKVYAIVGENGSGKSTLVKILSGVIPPDSGSIFVNGVPLARFAPQRALDVGLSTCFQEVLVADNLSVTANVHLWDRGWIRTKEKSRTRQERTRVLLENLGGGSIDPDGLVADLSLAEKQLVTIARAIAHPSASILIFDESTAALDQKLSSRVLDTMLKQAQTGSIVLFISHRFEEISQIADEMIVLRNGEIVGTMAHDEANGQRALTMMSGDEFTRLEAEDATLNATDEQKSGDHTHGMAIQVKDVKITSGGRPINLEFLQGEVTGLAGLDGHGQSSLLKLLGGILRPTSGVVECLVNGKQTTINNPHKAVHQRIVYVPRDRKTEGILPTLSVLENFSLATNPQRTRGGFISKSREVKDYQKYSRPLQIKVPSVDAPITALSGGNQQKVLIARWLAAEPEVILLDDPTRGVDGRTKSDLYALLTGLAREGKAIVLVSTEIEEFVSLCDRVIVMYQYGVSVDLRGPEISRSRIMSAMFRQEVE